MNNKLKQTFFIVIILVILTACSFSNNLNDSLDKENTIDIIANDQANINTINKEYINDLPLSFKQIHEQGKLHVATYSEDRFPYFFVDNQGELVGSDIKMAYDIAHQIGVNEVVFDRSAGSYDEMIDLVMENKVDLAIGKISVTLNRAQRVLYSEPYVELKQAILLNRVEFAKIKTENKDPIPFLKTNNVKIGVVSGTSYVEFAHEVFSTAEIVPFEDKDKMIQAVQKGDIIAAFYDEFELKRYVTDHPNALIELQIVIMDDHNDFLAIAIPPNNQQMQAWLKHFFDYQKSFNLDEVLEEYKDLYE